MRKLDWALVESGRVELFPGKTYDEVEFLAKERSLGGRDIRVCAVNMEKKSMYWKYSYIDGWRVDYE